MFFRKTKNKSEICSAHLNVQDNHDHHLTSHIEHLADKHPGLLRLFNSNLCTISIVINYLYSAKENLLQEYLGRKLFEYEHDEVDVYLPQLLNMYIHVPAIANVIREYIVTR